MLTGALSCWEGIAVTRMLAGFPWAMRGVRVVTPSTKGVRNAYIMGGRLSAFSARTGSNFPTDCAVTPTTTDTLMVMGAVGNALILCPTAFPAFTGPPSSPAKHVHMGTTQLVVSASPAVHSAFCAHPRIIALLVMSASQSTKGSVLDVCSDAPAAIQGTSPPVRPALTASIRKARSASYVLRNVWLAWTRPPA